jgi:hypothetical protein
LDKEYPGTARAQRYYQKDKWAIYYIVFVDIYRASIYIQDIEKRQYSSNAAADYRLQRTRFTTRIAKSSSRWLDKKRYDKYLCAPNHPYKKDDKIY